MDHARMFVTIALQLTTDQQKDAIWGPANRETTITARSSSTGSSGQQQIDNLCLPLSICRHDRATEADQPARSCKSNRIPPASRPWPSYTLETPLSCPGEGDFLGTMFTGRWWWVLIYGLGLQFVHLIISGELASARAAHDGALAELESG